MHVVGAFSCLKRPVSRSVNELSSHDRARINIFQTFGYAPIMATTSTYLHHFWLNLQARPFLVARSVCSPISPQFPPTIQAISVCARPSSYRNRLLFPQLPSPSSPHRSVKTNFTLSSLAYQALIYTFETDLPKGVEPTMPKLIPHHSSTSIQV